MSIVALRHAALFLPASERTQALARLQSLGCVHVIGFDGPAAIEVDARVRAALQFLRTSPRQHHRLHQAHDFDPAALVDAVEALRARAQALEEERDALARRIRDVAPWGHFHFRELESHPELRLWFYRLPPARLGELAKSDHVWRLVHRNLTVCNVVVVAAQEPADLTFPRVHVGSRTLERLEARLAEVEVALDDADEERARLTRWTDLFAAHVDRLLDDAARTHAAVALEAHGAIARLACWVPAPRAQGLADWADISGYALALRDPLPEEEPPTLLANAAIVEPGAGLVRFFATPAYRAWDPSTAVMASFILFFAMILGDAVYGAILCAGLAFFWRPMGRQPGLRLLAALLALATTSWGIVTGSYAGLAAPPTPWLAALKLIPAQDTQLMLRISLGVGLGHLILANALAGWNERHSTTSLARVGWIMIFLAAPLWLVAHQAAVASAGLGLALILLFTGQSRRPLARLAEGAMALPRLVAVLGDTLSYLRLFALGIATASLAGAFNMLAGTISAVPGTGAILALLVLVAGHGINLVLGVAGGVIHGLRLNYIEFFGWGLSGDGRPFLPFHRREQQP